MKSTKLAVIASVLCILAITFGSPRRIEAQDDKNPYPKMAPIEQYFMERDAEIALARSAAPESVSRDAEVLVLGRNGYETAIHGKNGFVCMIERSWTSPSYDPGFWNPKGRAPLCLNAAAARSYLPRTLRKTELILTGSSKDQMFEAITSAIAKKQLPALEAGSMCYMMSKQAHLSDSDPHWHPHLMFFVPHIEPQAWGADLPGSPIFAFNDAVESMTVFLVPVRIWSDGTPDAPQDGH